MPLNTPYFYQITEDEMIYQKEVDYADKYEQVHLE